VFLVGKLIRLGLGTIDMIRSYLKSCKPCLSFHLGLPSKQLTNTVTEQSTRGRLNKLSEQIWFGNELRVLYAKFKPFLTEELVVKIFPTIQRTSEDLLNELFPPGSLTQTHVQASLDWLKSGDLTRQCLTDYAQQLWEKDGPKP